MMSSSTSYDDREVERYLGFGGTTDRFVSSGRKFSNAVTPGRLKGSMSNKPILKRPKSACAVLSPTDRGTPFKKACEKRRVNKTPSSRRRRTPLHTPTKTPRESDRFIPPRASMNFQSSHHKILHSWLDNENTLDDGGESFENKNMNENLVKILGDSNTGVLQYQGRHGSPVKGTFSPMKLAPAGSCKKLTSRKIPSIPERVLDAPNYVDDYYLNLLDWSNSMDLIAVALDNSVYIWTPSSGEITHLCEVTEPENYVSSVKWVEDGSHLAIATVNGVVQLWDTEQKKRLRQMPGHASRIASLSWNSHVLSSGSRSGQIHNHDVRIGQHHISTFSSHTQEVCGLAWSPSGRYLASGSNNNKVVLWDWNQAQQSRTTGGVNVGANPIHVFQQHRAAVKALAWCPWQHHILASGGGSLDKSIRFWNVNSGNCLNTIQTDSQVSSLLWSETYQELVSGHGYPNNQLTVWQYPSMTKKANLIGHTSRVLQMTMSPDKTRVMSAAGDETLRLWHCFEMTKEQRKKTLKRRDHMDGLLSRTTLR